MKKRYEVIWEIYNKCSGNQMRDVFFEEFVQALRPGLPMRSRRKGVGRPRVRSQARRGTQGEP